MDSRNGFINFILFIFLFAFSFIFCLDALSLPNAFYGVVAAVGFLVCLIGSLFNGMMSQKDGEALAIWYYGFSLISGIVTVWYLTRCGSVFGWW